LIAKTRAQVIEDSLKRNVNNGIIIKDPQPKNGESPSAWKEGGKQMVSGAHEIITRRCGLLSQGGKPKLLFTGSEGGEKLQMTKIGQRKPMSGFKTYSGHP